MADVDGRHRPGTSGRGHHQEGICELERGKCDARVGRPRDGGVRDRLLLPRDRAGRPISDGRGSRGSTVSSAIIDQMPKLFVIAGAILMGIGLLLWAGFPLGKLPGDFMVRRGPVTFYFPLVSSILI